MTLLRRIGGLEAGQACLRFFKHLDEPKFRLSGWSCLGEDMPARRAEIGCMLNRLVLLAAGHDAKLAQLFAQAELRRSDCGASGVPVLSADWVMGRRQSAAARRALVPPVRGLAFGRPYDCGNKRPRHWFS